MEQWEYKVVPTPRRPKRAKGVKGNSDRFAFALTEAINEVAAEGWEFVKTETLPMEAKPGLFKARVEVFQSLMVFRRALAADQTAQAGDAGMITPAVAVAGAAALTAERYVEPTDQNQSQLSAEPEMVETSFDYTQEQSLAAEIEAEVAATAEAAADDVEFDVGNIDPLKKVVEANRTGS